MCDLNAKRENKKKYSPSGKNPGHDQYAYIQINNVHTKRNKLNSGQKRRNPFFGKLNKDANLTLKINILVKYILVDLDARKIDLWWQDGTEILLPKNCIEVDVASQAYFRFFVLFSFLHAPTMEQTKRMRHQSRFIWTNFWEQIEKCVQKRFIHIFFPLFSKYSLPFFLAFEMNENGRTL